MIPFLLHLWGKFPVWVHTLAAVLVRPRFRVAVAAIVFDEQGRILLFKHTYRKLAWGLPAGALEFGEQPIEGVKREFFEETSMTLQVERLLLADSSPYWRHVSLVYLGTVAAGEFHQSYEISEIQYFAVDQLPRMLLDEKELIRSVHQELFGEAVH